MKCPLCSAKAKENAAECPSCGAIFAKLHARKEREKTKAAAALAPDEPALPSFNPWHLRLAAAGIVIAWMLGFSLYYRFRLASPPRSGTAGARPLPATVEMRDPVTGDLKKLEVHRSPLPRRAEAPPPAAGEPARPAGAPAYDSDFDD